MNDKEFNDLETSEVEEMAEDLAEITLDFIENHNISLSEFNGIMLAQIVKSYMNNGYIDELKELVYYVQKHIDEVSNETL